jgi:hypothetical protein
MFGCIVEMKSFVNKISPNDLMYFNQKYNNNNKYLNDLKILLEKTIILAIKQTNIN